MQRKLKYIKCPLNGTERSQCELRAQTFFLEIVSWVLIISKKGFWEKHLVSGIAEAARLRRG